MLSRIKIWEQGKRGPLEITDIYVIIGGEGLQKKRPIFGAYGLWTEINLNRATPAVKKKVFVEWSKNGLSPNVAGLSCYGVLHLNPCAHKYSVMWKEKNIYYLRLAII